MKKMFETISESLTRILYRIEDTMLAGLLLIMIGMSVAQIFLRNLFESGISWGDVLVRILVLWIGLLGAMAASRQNRHISIDLLTRYLPERFRIFVNSMTAFFTAILCSIVTYHGFRFVIMEWESGSKAFAQVPVWICEAVIPFAFFVIGLRYFISAIIFMRSAIKGSHPS